MGIRVEPLEPASAPEDVLVGVHEVAAAIEVEEIPGDPPTPFAQRRLRLRAMPPADIDVTRWIAYDDDTIVGYGFLQAWPEEDPDNGLMVVQVLPEHRRTGIGRAILTESVSKAAEDGRGKMIMDCVDGMPWEPALERLGLKKALTGKQSRLHISELEMSLMDSWIERAVDRASEYDLLHMETPIPEKHLENWAHIKSAILDEPFEDLEFERAEMTSEKWRSRERYMADTGERCRVVVAVHRDTGQFVGHTTVHLFQHQPDLARQGDTAVDAGHRNRGLGRLMKATMIKRVVAEHPEVTRIDTHNAGSNRAMLGINIEMGFRPILVVNAWQGSTTQVLSNLGG